MKNTSRIAAISSFVRRRFPPPPFRGAERRTAKKRREKARKVINGRVAERQPRCDSETTSTGRIFMKAFSPRARNESAVQEQKEDEEVEVQQQQQRQQEVVEEKEGEGRGCRWTREEGEAREGGWVVRGRACTRLRIR